MNLSSDQAVLTEITSAPAAQRDVKPRYLYGPIADFLCLGGISFLLLPVMLILPQEEFSLTVAAVALGIAHFINHPHFALSYQIFYESFWDKAFGPNNNAMLRARYIFAGILVPLAFAAFLAYGLIFGDAQTLGYGANLMSFLVGWHYVKQGYGILMVDAALKRRFFNDMEKKILLLNCYAVWALAWLMINSMLSERTMWGIQYYMFHFPPLVLTVSTYVAIGTTALAITVLIQKWRSDRGLPVSGVAAYVTSLYLWLLLMHWNALWLLLVPVLHSLQYLVVATRYSMNRIKDETNDDKPLQPALLGRIFTKRYQGRYAAFILMAVILGFMGFWGAPLLLQIAIPYDEAVLGTAAFLFVFWVFINVHHYFLDNVMWRSQNPDVRKYLFA